MDIGVRAPKKARARDVGKKSVATIVVKPQLGAALTFPVFTAIKSIYGNERAFYVEKSPQRVVVKLKGERKAREDTATFTKRMNKVALEYAAEIEQGVNDGDADFANPFIDAGFTAVVAKRRAIPAPGLKKFAAYQEVIQEIIDSVIDASGKVIGTLPWQSDYVEYPTMNFFRLYTAHRRRRRISNSSPGTATAPLMRDLGLRYKGINLMRLVQDYSPVAKTVAVVGTTRNMLPFYLTERQATSLGGRVIPTAKRINLVFWKMADDPTGTMTREQRMKNGYPIKFTVVRVDAVDGDAFTKKVAVVVAALVSEAPAGTGDASKTAAAEAILAAILKRTPAPKIVEAPTEIPRFRPWTDEVIMPPRRAFTGNNAVGYYTTLFHELTHWTGAAGRLDRMPQIVAAEGAGSRGRGHTDNTYNKEELVAEMGAYLLASEAGFAPATRANSAAYITSWLRELQDKPFWLSTASRLASEAAEYLLSEYYTVGDYPSDTAAAIVADSAADAREYAVLLDVVTELTIFTDDVQEYDALPATAALVHRAGEIIAAAGAYVPQKYLEYYVLEGAYARNWTAATPVEALGHIQQMTAALSSILAEIPVPVAAADADDNTVFTNTNTNTPDFVATAVLGKNFGPAAEGAVFWSAGSVSVVSKRGASAPVCNHTHETRYLRGWLVTHFQPESSMQMCPTCAEDEDNNTTA